MPKKKAAEGGVGRVLLRHRFHRSKGYEHAPASHLHSAGDEEEAQPRLESTLERNDLDELLHNADLAGRDFTAARGNAQVLLDESFGTQLSLSEREISERRKVEEALNADLVTIPRRPPWNSKTSPEELDTLERQSFLEWRRGLASLEENQNLVLTPFEKNLDIWRQLWRVLERSDLIVTVVDGRNPLLYRCEDMEFYVRELDPKKRTLLLINKADLLPVDVRRQWASYFSERGIGFHFWSAKSASENTQHSDSSHTPPNSHPTSESSSEPEEKHRILGRDELMHQLEKEARLVKSQNGDKADSNGGDQNPGRVVVGFVGYPNVGKSSTINALVGQKKTGVTSTPGKTKHFQTLMISETLMLCDCPGLVFPSFAHSKAEMVASGVIPIDRLTDQRSPVEYVARQITREQIARVYGLRDATIDSDKALAMGLDPHHFSGVELLRVYARSRGFVSSSGLPDETRASRTILKDYLSGKLLHFHLPPVDEEDGEEEDEEEDNEWEENPNSMEPSSNAQELRETRGTDVRNSERDKEADSSDADPERNSEEEEAVDSRVDAGPPGDGGLDIVSLMMSDRGSALNSARPRRSNAEKSSHKMHKKVPRKKDRSWRAGRGDADDDTDGMPIRVIQKPVSHGAANLASVLPSQRHIVSR